MTLLSGRLLKSSAAPPVTAASLTSLVAWFDYTDGTTLFQANTSGVPSGSPAALGNSVGGWTDKSGAGNHLFGAGTTRPVVASTGINFVSANPSYLDGKAIGFAGDFCIFMVACMDTHTLNARIFDFDYASSLLLMGGASANQQVAGDARAVSPYGPICTASDGTFHIFRIQRSGTAFSFDVDNGTPSTSTLSGALAAKRLCLGAAGLDDAAGGHGSGLADMHVKEFIIAQNANLATQGPLFSALRTKHGTP